MGTSSSWPLPRVSTVKDAARTVSLSDMPAPKLDQLQLQCTRTQRFIPLFCTAESISLSSRQSWVNYAQKPSMGQHQQWTSVDSEPSMSWLSYTQNISSAMTLTRFSADF